MKIIIGFLLVLTVSTVFAQKIKVKKGEIFLDSKKAGTVEKIKVKGKGKYVKVSDNKGNALFEAKLVLEDSKYFGNKKKHRYFIVKCLTKNDTIGVEKLGFYTGEKKLVSYLVKNKLFGLDGINNENVEKILAETTTRPSYVLKEMAIEDKLIKNKDFKVDRDITQKLFIVNKKTKSSYGIISGLPINPIKYELFQGEDFKNKTLIGYAILENENNRSRLFILNVKEVPLAMFNNFRYYSFYPTEEFKISKSMADIIRLDKPVKAIKQLTNYLINKGEL